MATTNILKFVVASVIIQFCSCDTFLWGMNEEYNALCAKTTDVISAVAMPNSLCDPVSYISCWASFAIVIQKCPVKFRFDREHQWCEEEAKISMPPKCQEPLAPNEPKTCEELVNGRLPHPTTCRKYIWCVNGLNYTMNCQKLAYFIAGKSYDNCLFDTDGRFDSMPVDAQNALADCKKRDPWPASDYSPPTTASTKKP